MAHTTAVRAPKIHNRNAQLTHFSSNTTLFGFPRLLIKNLHNLHKPVAEQIVNMPELPLGLFEMPFYSSLKIVLSRTYIGIGALLKIHNAQSADVNSNVLSN